VLVGVYSGKISLKSEQIVDACGCSGVTGMERGGGCYASGAATPAGRRPRYATVRLKNILTYFCQMPSPKVIC